MNPGLALIAAVLESRDMAEALKLGVEPDLFDDRSQLYWETLVGHYEKFHEVPTVAYFQQLVPDYEHHVSGDSVAALTHELKTNRLGNAINDALDSIARLNMNNPWDAKKELVELSDKINVRNQEGNDLLVAGADEAKVLKLLERLRETGGLLGTPWPWDCLNAVSRGICAGDVYYFYGRQKSKKTFIMLFLAIHFALQGMRVLVFARDQPGEEILWRLYAMICDFELDRFEKGEITTEGQEMLRDVMKELRERQNIIISKDCNGIAGMKAKIKEVRPHIVIHDYWKALADDAMGDRRTAVGEHNFVARVIDQIVSFAKDDAKIPFIICGHANREGAKTKGRSDVEQAWSDHITRRVDGAFRVINDNKNERIAIVVNVARSIRSNISFTISGHCGPGFGDVLEENAHWLQNWDEAKEEEEASQDRTGAGAKGTGEKTKFSKGDWKKPTRVARR